MKHNKTYKLEIGKDQLIELVKKLDYNDQVDLIRSLQENTYLLRFEKLLNSTKTNELSLDDITKEVEAVRSNRYNGGKHKI